MNTEPQPGELRILIRNGERVFQQYLLTRNSAARFNAAFNADMPLYYEWCDVPVSDSNDQDAK